jgi:hypothetical protein
MYIKVKMIPVETILGIGWGGAKGDQWRGWIHVLCTWYFVKTFVNAPTHPHLAQ